jgi:hypothetical protein
MLHATSSKAPRTREWGSIKTVRPFCSKYPCFENESESASTFERILGKAMSIQRGLVCLHTCSCEAEHTNRRGVFREIAEHSDIVAADIDVLISRWYVSPTLLSIVLIAQRRIFGTIRVHAAIQ